MTLAERITQELESLPEESQREILNFVEFLKAQAGRREVIDWNRFSLEQALQGLENEPDLYSENDVRDVAS